MCQMSQHDTTINRIITPFKRAVSFKIRKIREISDFLPSLLKTMGIGQAQGINTKTIIYKSHWISKSQHQLNNNKYSGSAVWVL